MRDYILFYVNGEKVIVTGDDIFLPLATFLRKRLGLSGTKIVCSEGDCGACSVLRSSLLPKKSMATPVAINSCISFVFQNDLSHLFTVEAISLGDKLHPVQESMRVNQGSQCGFCTPGIVVTLAGLFEKSEIKKLDRNLISKSLIGNLCRCTGYKDILTSGTQIKIGKSETLLYRYHKKEYTTDLLKAAKLPISFKGTRFSVSAPLKIKDAAELKKRGCKIINGATDLGVLFNKEALLDRNFLSLHLVSDLYRLKNKGRTVRVGANCSLSNLQKLFKSILPEGAKLLSLFASPQIRNCGTLVGNVVNASPIADTIPLLSVLSAEIKIAGISKARTVNINSFYKGYKKLDLKADEIVTEISFKLPSKNEIIKHYKISRRKDLDIATICAVMRFRVKNNQFENVALAFGGVGPTFIKPLQTESILKRKKIKKEIFISAARSILTEITPISDVRASQETRELLAQNLFLKCFHELTIEKKI